MTTSWKFNKDSFITNGDVVTAIKWSLVASNENVSWETNGTVDLAEPDLANFIQFENIDEGKAIQWVIEAMGVPAAAHFTKLVEDALTANPDKSGFVFKEYKAETLKQPPWENHV